MFVISAPDMLYRGATNAVRAGKWKRALFMLRILRWSPLASKKSLVLLEFAALSALRDPASMERAFALLQNRAPSWRETNIAVDCLISVGRYREALERAARMPEDMRPSPGVRLPTDYALVQINLAEALYNLGRWEEAERILDPLHNVANDSWLLGSGVIMQRAWIASHRGRAAEAWALMEQRPYLGPRYQSEIHFTRAAALRELKRLDEAEREARAGLLAAVRPSSVRNAHFVLGHVEIARGNLAAAERHFATGAANRWQGQGGDGLLAWGDCLAAQNRRAEAETAWNLAIARDPQSECASIATSRLAAPAVVHVTSELIESIRESHDQFERGEGRPVSEIIDRLRKI